MAVDLSKLSDSDLNALAKGDLRMMSVKGLQLVAGEPQEESVAQMAGNFGAGLIRGAGSIGATLLAPVDMASDYIDGKGLSLESNRKRRQAMDEGLSMLGVDTESGLYTAGKIGGEIAGTAGAGGLVAKGLSALPVVGNALSKFAPVIESGGFTLGKPAATTMLGKVGDFATRAAGGAIQGGTQALMVDPEQAKSGATIGAVLPGAVKGAGMLGSGIKNAATGTVKNFLGASTGAGADAVAEAYKAGKSGSTAFIDNMRGDVPFDDVVQQARSAVQNMRIAKNEAYRSGMIDIKNDKTVLNFSPIDKALEGIKSMGSFKGQEISDEAASTVQKLVDKVSSWKSLDPTEFHTPEGIDALKQAVGEILASTKPNTTSNTAAKQVYNAIKSQIDMQAPTYSKVMKDYSKASDLIKEIEGALSLGQRAKADTAIRKLQSLMRNNAQTNYGNRQNLVRQLEDQGGTELIPAIAGQAMNSWMPRGVIGAIEKAGAVGSIPLGFSGAAAAMAPFASPRIVGEAAYGLGRASGGVNNAASVVSQKLGAPSLSGLLDESIYARTLPLSILGYQASQQ